MKKFSIKLWNEDDRPIEKLLKNGASILSNAELIAIIIKTGNLKESAVDLSKAILLSCDNNLNILSKKTHIDLIKFNGVGDKKAAAIIASLELGKRLRQEKVLDQDKIEGPDSAFDLFFPHLGHINHEEFWVAYLNRANKVIKYNRVGQGGLNETTVDVKVIMKQALDLSSSSIILCHNHPSGNLVPSDNDVTLTNKIKKACLYFDISIMDHLIIANNEFYSFVNNSLL